MTTAELKPTKVTATDGNAASAGLLLEHIATASLLEEKFNGSSDAEDESDEEVFEDGDANDHSNREEEGDDHEEFGDARDRDRHESVAAVLTELSQATTPVARNTNGSSTTPSPAAFPLPSKPIPNPSMSATINTINAYLQSHLLSVPSAGQPQKARLYGPIRANVNIRHGVWAPRLRCRKRKNLHAKDGIWINPTCTLDHLIYLVKSVLPDEFEWDSQTSPLRYQAVNDQSLQSLKTVSGTVTSGQSLFSAFDLVRNRRSDGDNFILQLYVYGTWTVLLKPHNYQSTGVLGTSGGLDEDMMNSVSLPPPPKKKYQQAHYNQQQMQQMQQMNIVSSEESNLNGAAHNSGMFHMRLSPPSNAAAITSSSSSSHYTHPLSANPPVTFLPTVTLEMKMNGIFVPVEISRRSFVSAIRACSLPKPNNVGVGGSVVNDASAAAVAAVASNSSTISGVSSGIPPSPPPPQTNNANPNNNNTNTINITPPPSEV